MDQQQYNHEQAIDMMMNVFYNHEASPTLLSIQAPHCIANNAFLNSGQATGLVGRYNILLSIIESLKKDVKPIYMGSRTSAERLKRNINLAKNEIRNCMFELEKLNQNNQS